MPEQFLHGVEVVEISGGSRPITTVKSSVIGLVGTAPNADIVAFPANTPVLIAGNLKEAAKLDTVGNGAGTLPDAINGIFDQVGAVVIVIRVDEGVDFDATKSNIIGGVDANSDYTGIKALLAAETITGHQPRILIAPGFAHDAAVATELDSVADQLKAIAIIDGPNTNDADAQTYRTGIGSPRLYLVDPQVKVWDTATDTEAIMPASSRVAGLIAKTDNDQGFWWSPSNKVIKGITGTARHIDFKLGDVNSRANLLNENEIATIIRQDGFRLWGNRTTSADPKWAFISVRRTADIIQDSLLRSMQWAIDNNINAGFFDNVKESVNAYLRSLTAIGAILGGECWVDPELNTKEVLQAGKAYFNLDFTPPTPAEKISFQSELTNRYFSEVV